MLNHLSDNRLFELLECENLKALQKKLNDEKFNALLTQYHLFRGKYNRFNLASAFFDAINDSPYYHLTSMGYIIAAIITTCFSLAIPIILISTLPVFALTAYFTFTSYKELKKENIKFDKNCLLTFIKNMACDELAKRHGNKIFTKNFQASLAKDQNKLESPKDKNKLSRWKGTFGVILYTSSTLFATYFVAVAPMMKLLGYSALATAFSGPIGLGIALTVSLLFAGVLACIIYRASKNNQLLNAKFEAGTKITNKKMEACLRFKENQKKPTLHDSHAVTKKLIHPKATSLLQKASLFVNRKRVGVQLKRHDASVKSEFMAARKR